MRRVGSVCILSTVLLALAGALFGQGRAPAEARAAAEAYLDAFLDVDAERLERLVHDAWRMSALMPDGAYREAARDEYLESVRAASGRDDRTAYTGRVANVTVQGRAAIALLEVESAEARFHEFISMLRTDDGWQVVQKTVDVEMK